MDDVVVNSTPIIVLGNCGLLEILQTVFGSIAIPKAVLHEVSVKDDEAARFLLSRPSWIKVLDAPKPSEMSLLPAKLHAGEIEVILLAKACNASAVVLDDNAARRAASFLGLNVTGTLGVLLAAKQRGDITAIEPVVNTLRSGGFRISDEVISYVLRAAGER